MIAQHLARHIARHIAATRNAYSVPSWLLCMARTSRVLLHPAPHRALCALPLFREFIATPANHDVFHHLSHRHYLARHFGARERTALALDHLRFEDAAFDDAYKRAVYLGDGLCLWQGSTPGCDTRIVLAMSPRRTPEGDLTVTLRVDGVKVHRISFNWVRGELAGLAVPLVPFIGRNQGHGPDEVAEFERFGEAYPNNSPSYFCLAAVDGIAQAIGVAHMVAVSARDQLVARPGEGKVHTGAYDGFWEAVGGLPLPGGRSWLVPVPFHVKPLAEMASKHRKRAAQRRAWWQQITESSRDAVLARRIGAPQTPLPAREETAEA